MKYCRSCGSGLALPEAGSGGHSAVGGRMPSAADVVGRTGNTPHKIACTHCGGETPAGFKFCQQCGKGLDAASVADAPTSPVMPSPVRKTASPEPGSRPPGVRGTIPGAQKAVVVPDPMAETLAASRASAATVMAEAHQLARKQTIEEDPAIQNTLPETPVEQIGHTPAGHLPAMDTSESGRGVAVASMTGPAWGKLVTVRQDGSDGRAFPLTGDSLEVGRACTGLVFSSDRYLAPVHARLERSSGSSIVTPIDRFNGVFRRLRAQVILRDRDQVLVGRELLEFSVVGPDEREVTALVQNGVVRFGSPPREPWGRLAFLIPNGATRDVRYLTAPELVIGREEGDLIFRDDEFLSRRHAVLLWNGGQCQLEDLNSSNGTYLRLREPTALQDRDHLRMGNQLFRFEAIRA